MTIDEKLKALVDLIKGNKRITEKMLNRLLPVNEILVIQLLNDQVLIYSDVYVGLKQKYFVSDTIAFIKKQHRGMKHNVTKLTRDQYKEILAKVYGVSCLSLTNIKKVK